MKWYFAQKVIDAGDANLPQTPVSGAAGQQTLEKILTIAFVTIGAIALLMVVIGGLRYIHARNNPDSVKVAKNMIIYSLIGLVLAAMAAVIVQYVLGTI